MTDQEQREAARKFISRWMDIGDEKQDCHNYWISFLSDVMGISDVTNYIQFERRVVVDGQTKYIDGYIPDTRVLIEQKGHDIDLTKKERQSDGKELTPYEQGKRYANNMPLDEMPRYIVTCNFQEFRIHDQNKPGEKPTVIELNELQDKFYLFEFLIKKEHVTLSEEMQLSKDAGTIVGDIYDAFLKQYKDPTNEHSLKSLNALCVRLVFCFYAEDAGLFGRHALFHDYLTQYPTHQMREALRKLFKVLDEKPEERDEYLEEDDSLLASFPYVNGGLFSDENIEIPPFTDEIRGLILKHASEDFDWHNISPTIFGAVFESTLNPETRRSGGMHYTSIENIHKVIDPLFLDDLRKELADIEDISIAATKRKRLSEYQDKLAGLTFLDPACGSGNFLTETYLSLRRLENEVFKQRVALDKHESEGQIMFGIGDDYKIKVTIQQFYGIEINDFAVTVAKTALWISEAQMLKETEDIIHREENFLPLRTYDNIVEGNALKIDWNTIIARDKLSYVMGNPPFIGASMMNEKQKKEAVNVFGKVKMSNSIDYVGAWYQLAARYIQDTVIQVAFVSTNSITQGEQVKPLWNKILFENHCRINFAYRTFRWDSEANEKAHVHCVIIGFSSERVQREKYIYTTNYIKSENNRAEDISCDKAENINPYLVDAPDVLIESVGKPICDVPVMTKGNQPTDGGNFILSEEEKSEMLKGNPEAIQYIRRYVGARDFINNDDVRYCLWLKDVSPNIYKQNCEVMRRLKAIQELRSKSSAAPTRKSAEFPYRFFSTPQTDETFLIIPRVSSQRRRYIPIGFMLPEVIAADSCSIICGATIYHFGILSSNVHMAWMRTVGGRLKSDYRYSGSVVYNNFPWPSPTLEQKARIEQTAQEILDARMLHKDSSLADLYDPLTMPPELRKAHVENDKAVMAAYGFITKMSEAECVAELMKMYKELAN